MSYVVIDVREPYEFNQGHVDGALNIPPAKLLAGAKELASIQKNSKIIVYCRTGSRAKVAQNILHSLGYTNITNGINAARVEASYSL